jgi:hypothetical protein
MTINGVNWKVLDAKDVIRCQQALEDNKLHISILPDEIFSIIFNHFKLDLTEEIGNFHAIAFTCKHWYVIQTEKIFAFFEALILKKADIKTIQSSSSNCPEMGIPRYVSRRGVYLQFLDGDFAFYNKNGSTGNRFSLKWQHYFFEHGILELSDEKIQLLQPYTAEVKDTLTLPEGKGPASFYVDPTGQSLLVHYQEDKSTYFCNLNAAPISAKEIQVEQKEKFSFDKLKFDGTSLLLLQQPHVSAKGEATSVQFSFWQLKQKILSQTLSQIGHCDGFSAHVDLFYLHNNHVVATDAYGYQLYYHDFKTKEERIDRSAEIAPGETIDKLCCAGEGSSVFSTFYLSKDGYPSGKIYVWKHNSGEIKLIQALEKRGAIEHMHLIGRQIIAASGLGSILIVDRKSDAIFYKYEGPYSTWSISHHVGRANQLALKFVKMSDEADQQNEKAVVLFDFLPEAKQKHRKKLNIFKRKI